MAEDAAKKVSQTQTQETGSQKVKLDVLSLVIFVLLCINIFTVGAMGYFLKNLWTQFESLEHETRQLASKSEEQDLMVEKKLKEPELGILFPMESFLVNINSSQGPKFLQTQLEFELPDPGIENEIAQKKPAIRDTIIVLLSSRTYEELKDPSGMTKLRSDLLRSVNNLLSSGRVKALYFTQFHFN